MNNKTEKFSRLIEILKKLRSPNGCDWDKEQTHKSLIPYLVEETYEVIEAIENNNSNELKEELGDLLLHVLFQAELSSEKGDFDIFDSLDSINNKLINRHPHVFNKDLNDDSWNRKGSWEQSKKKEKREAKAQNRKAQEAQNNQSSQDHSLMQDEIKKLKNS